MISLEQIQQLDVRVRKAVAALKALSAENAELKQKLAEMESRVETLNQEAGHRMADEERLEISLQGVLDVLDQVDDEMGGSQEAKAPKAPEAGRSQDSPPRKSPSQGGSPPPPEPETEDPETIDLDAPPDEVSVLDMEEDEGDDEGKLQSDFDIF